MDKNGLFPIYNILHVAFWRTTFFYYIMVFLGAVFLLFIVWYLLKKYKLSKRKIKSASDIALEELLHIEKLVKDNKIIGQVFYFRLTWIFKRYFNDNYGFDVYGKTDDELFLYIESSGLCFDLVNDMKAIFEGSSFIKFAKERVVVDRMKKDLKLSIEFINKTKKQFDKTKK